MFTKKKYFQGALLFVMMLLALTMYGCSESNDGESTVHDDTTWVSSGHRTAAQEDNEPCKACHGNDFFGGSSGYDCYNCHFGPNGRYKPSDVIEIVGVTPAENNADGTTSSLPNVAVNTYVYLKAKNADSETTITWNLSAQPTGSATALTNVDSSSVKFLPDIKGFYTIDATVVKGDVTTTGSVVIYANAWVGAQECEECHSDKYDGWKTTHHSDANDRKLEIYYNGGYYGETCQQCHTVGYNTAAYAVNNGYDDRALEEGFTLENLLTLSSFDLYKTTYPKTAVLSNIQCENCHGPREEHKGVSSLSEKVCAQCHDAPTHHVKVYQWELSGHGNYNSAAFNDPIGPEETACVKCHTGGGFIDYINGVAEEDRRTDFQPVTCPVCHDPHSGTNEHQVRTTSDVTLANGVVVTNGGLGKLCMNCHQSRRNVDTYVTEYHERFGPHNASQADIYNGTGGFEYGEDIASSAHPAIITDSCVTCHMGSPDDEALWDATTQAYMAGEHTFKMKNNDVGNVAPCKTCHSSITTFNFTAQADYDGDGTIEGVQDEVRGLMDAVAMKLPPLDSTDITVAADYTDAQLKAAYNYKVIQKDNSYGIHNFKYTVDLLQTSYRNLVGSDVPGATIIN